MRTPNLPVSFLVVAAAALLVRGWTPDPAPANSPEAKSTLRHEVQLPVPGSLAFEPNRGQAGGDVRFLARGPGYALFLTDAGVVMRLAPAGQDDSSDAVVAMTVANANAAPRISGEQALGSTSSYLLGNDPARWHRDVPHFAKVRYEGMYPGIDAVFYGNAGELEYDFVVAPGADPGIIALDYSGVDGMSLDDGGNLVLDTGAASLVQRAPVIYQVVDGVRRLVDGTYRLLDEDSVGFALGAFDPSLALTIDPVLGYGTYLGGDGYDASNAITVDDAGRTWVVGETESLQFPFPTNDDSDFEGGLADAYICRFHATGGLSRCTYVGGDGSDSASSIAVGGDGNIYVAGTTDSSMFPVLNALQSTPGPGPGGDAFLLKINDAGDGLAFSTYVGGDDVDAIRALATDPAGGIYAVGHTWSMTGFPVTGGAFQTTDTNGADAFVLRVSTNGSLWSATRLGGNQDDFARGVTTDSIGRVWVSGFTDSADFPVAAPFQGAHAGGTDVFLARLNAGLSSMQYGTYLGGSGDEWGYDVRVARTGLVHLVGSTSSTDFPVQSPAQATLAGLEDGFLATFAPSGATLQYSTYLGGTEIDDLRHLELDHAGNLHLAGYTWSGDFPIDGTLHGGPMVIGADTVLLKLAPDGRTRLDEHIIAGTGHDVLAGLALDTEGNPHVTGWTDSADLPVARAVQGKLASELLGSDPGYDIFVAKFSGQHLRSWAGDFNGDGVDDVLWRNNETGQGTIWHSANPNTAVNLTRVINLDWRIVGVGDFDGDGRSDLFWRNLATGANVVWRSAIATTPLSTRGVTNVNWEVQAIGDFDGDGRDDVVWHDVSTGQSALWYSANANLAATLVRITNLAWDIVGAGDFDGDGKDDLFWREGRTGQNALWSGGDYRAPIDVAGIPGNDWVVVGIGDFQGDGKDDLAWRNVVDGRNTLWRGASSAQGQALTGVRQQYWQVFGAGDYDGDGKADLLWRDVQFGFNVIWRSGNGGTPRAMLGVRNQAWTPRS